MTYASVIRDGLAQPWRSWRARRSNPPSVLLQPAPWYLPHVHDQECCWPWSFLPLPHWHSNTDMLMLQLALWASECGISAGGVRVRVSTSRFLPFAKWLVKVRPDVFLPIEAYGVRSYVLRLSAFLSSSPRPPVDLYIVDVYDTQYTDLAMRSALLRYVAVGAGQVTTLLPSSCDAREYGAWVQAGLCNRRHVTYEGSLCGAPTGGRPGTVRGRSGPVPHRQPDPVVFCGRHCAGQGRGGARRPEPSGTAPFDAGEGE